ncbi:uncharacterized protein EV154DRAFT_429728, partial [Mucor mucedo]|uniref:uncharacterized protein n=1 Tax=Mucor mucedo TaxID=29922 RepID=UPI00221EA486
IADPKLPDRMVQSEKTISCRTIPRKKFANYSDSQKHLAIDGRIGQDLGKKPKNNPGWDIFDH